MRTFIVLAVLGLASQAQARMPQPRMDVVEAAVDTSTSSCITIASGTATDVVGGSVILSSATILEIYNTDSTSIINCGFESNVSTVPYVVSSGAVGAAYGREILPKTGMYYGVNMDKTIIWCKSQATGSGNPVRAVITKGR